MDCALKASGRRLGERTAVLTLSFTPILSGLCLDSPRLHVYITDRPPSRDAMYMERCRMVWVPRRRGWTGAAGKSVERERARAEVERESCFLSPTDAVQRFGRNVARSRHHRCSQEAPYPFSDVYIAL